MRLSPRDRVLLEYGALEEGDTINGEPCPHCGGGVSGDRSLSVSKRDGNLLWICYRASCPFQGGSGHSGSRIGGASTAVPSTRGITGRWIARQAEGLPTIQASYLRERYGITTVLAAAGGLGWDVETERLTMPVRSLEGEELGVVLRTLSNQVPKTLAHTEPGALAWYPNRTTKSLIIVEDQLSAIRASAYSNSVALLGTNLNDARIDSIKKSKLSPVYLALDNDAIAPAVRYVVKYRSILSMRLLRLDKDIKDMSDTELRTLLGLRED